MTPIDLPVGAAQALDDVGLVAIPVRYLSGLWVPPGRRVTNLSELEAEGWRLALIGPGRCPARKDEPTGRPRRWRCTLAAGHDGRHRHETAHRVWD